MSRPAVLRRLPAVTLFPSAVRSARQTAGRRPSRPGYLSHRGGGRVGCFFFLFAFRRCCFPPNRLPRPLCLWISIGRGLRPHVLLPPTCSSQQQQQQQRQAHLSRQGQRGEKGGTRGRVGRGSASANTVGGLVLRRMANIISSLLILNVAKRRARWRLFARSLMGRLSAFTAGFYAAD